MRLIALLPFAALQVFASHSPTVDDLLNLKSASSPRVSPDGTRVAYTVTSTDWKQDDYISQLWIAIPAAGRTFQLTRGEKSASQAQWSPDGAWLTFVTQRSGGKPQVYAIATQGGEAVQLTKSENGVNSYKWSRDGKFIAYTTSDEDEKSDKKRKEHLGPFEVVRREYKYSQLWTFDVAQALESPVTGMQRTKGRDLTVRSFNWSPYGAHRFRRHRQP
jgi:dipeptidyl aminopeptidase/acylaminoacyl peptidase